MAECPEDYTKIRGSCAKSYQSKFKNIKIKVDDSLVGKVMLYQTELGAVGKLLVLSVNKDKQSCDVLLEFESSQKGSTFGKTENLFIQRTYGSWNFSGVSLDKDHLKNDLKLIQETKGSSSKCYLESDQAKFHLHHKNKIFKPAEGSKILYYGALVLIFIAVFLIAQTFFEDESKFKAQEVLETSDDTKQTNKKQDVLLKYAKPFFKRYFTPIVASMKNKKHFRDKYRKKLANAGLLSELSPEDFFALKLFLIIGTPIIYVIIREFLGADWPLQLVIVMPVLGYFYPNIWLNSKIEKRKSEVVMAMPFIVDMLALSVEAGLDFMAAISRVIEKAPPSALVDEFKILIKETKVGASRADGLRQLSWRTNNMQVASFTATLIAADQVGASIAPILKSLSLEMRQKRSALAEEKGATAGTKILIPVMAFILPAVMLIIAAPFFLEFVS